MILNGKQYRRSCSAARKANSWGFRKSHKSHLTKTSPDTHTKTRARIHTAPATAYTSTRTSRRRPTAAWVSRRKYLPLLPPVPRSRRSETSFLQLSLVGLLLFFSVYTTINECIRCW